MKRYFRIVALMFSAALSLTGCRHATVFTRETISIVSDILSDTQGRSYQYLSSIDPRDPHGDIVILDIPERCFSLSEMFMTCDRHDNIDGSRIQDYLPDFAGETITSIIDLAYSPYDRFADSGNDGALREITVKAALASIDTVSSKPRSKMIVIASPCMDAYGSFDVDTLLASTGATIPVVTLSDAVKDCLPEKDNGAKSDFAYVIGASDAGITAYQTLFGPVCHLFRTDSLAVSDSSSVSPLHHLLDIYAGAGNSMPLAALVFDDGSVPVSAMEAEYHDIMNNPDEDNFRYRRLLSNDFKFIDARVAMTDRCFRILRDRNLFTHNIAYPIASAYIVPAKASEYVLSPFDIQYLPAALDSLLEVKCPKTFKSYVPDQHFSRGN